MSEIHIADYAAQRLNSEKSKSTSHISAINNLTIRDLVGEVKPDFSKAFGENGEPLAAFHGSPSTFTVFDPRKGHNTEAIWHSSSRAAASHWSGTSVSTRFDPALIERIENASTIEELEILGEEEYGLKIKVRDQNISKEDDSRWSTEAGQYYFVDIDYPGGVSVSSRALYYEGIRPYREWSTDAQRKLLIMPI